MIEFGFLCLLAIGLFYLGKFIGRNKGYNEGQSDARILKDKEEKDYKSIKKDERIL